MFRTDRAVTAIWAAHSGQNHGSDF